MSEAADQDLRDVFKLLYDTDEWAMDDEEAVIEPITNAEETTLEPEVEQVEADLDDATDGRLERYSRKRFMDDLNDLMGPSTKRQRIYVHAPVSTSTSIPCTDPFPPLPSTSGYAPFSPLPLLCRLRTFKPSSYSPYMPAPLTATRATLYGWTNDGRDSLSCAVCQARWDLTGVTDIRDEKVRVEVARRLGPGLENKHKKGCSWRVRRSPDSLVSQLRRLLHPPVTSNLSVLAGALETECVARAKSDFRWTSPLIPEQVEHLVLRLTPHTHHHAQAPGSDFILKSPTLPLSSFAATLALFCWYPYHPNSPSHSIPSPVEHTPRRTDIVQCRMCERRVGLWAFRSASVGKAGDGKVFDLVGEHLGWCPIRNDVGAGKWWQDLPLLRQREKSALESAKGWIIVSGKMEVKPWRRDRADTTAPP